MIEFAHSHGLSSFAHSLGLLVEDHALALGLLGIVAPIVIVWAIFSFLEATMIDD